MTQREAEQIALATWDAAVEATRQTELLLNTPNTPDSVWQGSLSARSKADSAQLRAFNAILPDYRVAMTPYFIGKGWN